MNEKKLAAIKAAYGDAWEKAKNHVMSPANKGFWCCIPPYEAGFDGEIEQYGFSSWRPKSLSGIEHNYGWIRCDERLPEMSDAKYHICEDDKPAGITNGFSVNNVYKAHSKAPNDHVNITHWKPVEEVKPPIY